MRLTGAELRKLLAPLAACVALLAAGAGLIFAAARSHDDAGQRLVAARESRNKNVERLARIAEEEREVKAKLAIYEQLSRLHILGEERRLEWADAISRIRTERELLDLRYRVDRQQLMKTIPGKPGDIEFYESPMHVEIALLHEGDLLRFLHDLRASGNAYYSVKHCSVTRTGQAPTGSGIVPRLSAACDIDLITIRDGGAKKS